MSNKKYVYNMKQANFFMQEGVRCLGTGYNGNSKRVFYIFNYDEIQPAYEKWNKMKQEDPEYFSKL